MVEEHLKFLILKNFESWVVHLYKRSMKEKELNTGIFFDQSYELGACLSGNQSENSCFHRNTGIFFDQSYDLGACLSYNQSGIS